MPPIKPIIQSSKKNLVIQIFIGTFFIIVMIMLVIVILSYMGDTASEECCKQYNATYVWFECQCGVVGCSEDLQCGNYCYFDDGHYEQTDKLNCVFNST